MPPNSSSKKAWITPVVALLVLGGLIFLGLKSSKKTTDQTLSTNTTPAIEWPSEQVKKETITDSNKVYEITVYYPVTKSEAITMMFKNFITEQIDSFKQDSGADGGLPEGFRAVTLDITYEERKALRADNYVFLVYTDTGGAHGLQTTHTFSFAKTGETIKLSDLFTNGMQGLGTIADAVKKDLMKREFADAEWIAEGAAPTEENYQNFVVEDSGITFIFDPYQVAPYSSGAQTVSVPVSAFKAIANPEFFGTKQ